MFWVLLSLMTVITSVFVIKCVPNGKVKNALLITIIVVDLIIILFQTSVR